MNDFYSVGVFSYQSHGSHGCIPRMLLNPIGFIRVAKGINNMKMYIFDPPGRREGNSHIIYIVYSLFPMEKLINDINADRAKSTLSQIENEGGEGQGTDGEAARRPEQSEV